VSRGGAWSIRTRLALRFACVVGALLLVYAGVVYAFTRSALGAQLDARLHEDFEAAEHGFGWTPAHQPVWTRTSGAGDVPADERGEEAPWAEVRDPDGRVLLPPPPGHGPPAGPVRTYERDYVKDGRTYRIVVGRSEEPMRRQMARLLALLAACLVPVVAFSFLAGRWFAGRALAPVEAMAARARAISAERLSERLPVPQPDDELGRLASVFNDTFARLERSFDELRRFTSDASHELRTPLAVLKSVGEVGLRQAGSADELREVVGSMLEETDRLARLVDALLTLSRADAGRTPVALEPVALADLALQVVQQLGVLAEEKRQTVTVAGDLDARVSADPRLLGLAFANLLDNAIKYGPPGSRIAVDVRRESGEASVAVTDEGPGIPAEHQPRVFERFYRVDPARPRGGVGLGLAIARWAVGVQGGRLLLASAPGAGSTFRIVLPAPPASPAAPARG
jgi:heavy metal sensor kinase